MIASEFSRSSAILLNTCESSPISSLLVIAIRSEKSPFASFFAVALICTSGTQIDFTKYSPVNTTSSITHALAISTTSIIVDICLSTMLIEVTKRSAL